MSEIERSRALLVRYSTRTDTSGNVPVSFGSVTTTTSLTRTDLTVGFREKDGAVDVGLTHAHTVFLRSYPTRPQVRTLGSGGEWRTGEVDNGPERLRTRV